MSFGEPIILEELFKLIAFVSSYKTGPDGKTIRDPRIPGKASIVMKLIFEDEAGSMLEATVFNQTVRQLCEPHLSIAEVWRMRELYNNIAPLKDYLNALPPLFDCIVLTKPSKFAIKSGDDVSTTWHAEVYDMRNISP